MSTTFLLCESNEDYRDQRFETLSGLINVLPNMKFVDYGGKSFTSSKKFNKMPISNRSSPSDTEIRASP